MANALPLLCPDGAVGVAVAARDEAVQLRPLGERHHQGGGRGSLYYDKPPSRCGSLVATETAVAETAMAAAGCCHSCVPEKWYLSQRFDSAAGLG